MTTMLGPNAVEERIVEREHQTIRAGLALLRGTIEDAHRLTRSEMTDRVARATAWLHREVLPHAAWEEAWLYPHADQATGTPWTTRGLRFQHEQIRELATALEHASVLAHTQWTSEVAYGLVAAMARLDSLISAHLALEELSALPLLEDDPIDTSGAAPAAG